MVNVKEMTPDMLTRMAFFGDTDRKRTVGVLALFMKAHEDHDVQSIRSLWYISQEGDTLRREYASKSLHELKKRMRY